MVKKLAATFKDAKTFFESLAINEYFSNLVKIITKKYSKKTLTMEIVYNKSNEHYAYTDYNKIFVNAANAVVEAKTNLVEKLLIVTGFIAHELAHNLYSNPKAKKSNMSFLQKGKFYPRNPDIRDIKFQENLNEILEMLKTDDYFVRFFISLVNDLQNLFEDGYIENRFLREFVGKLATGLRKVRSIHWSQMDTVQEIKKQYKDGEYHKYVFIRQYLFQYAKYGKYKIEKTSDLKDPLVREAYSVKEYIDAIIKADNANDRQDNVNKIIVTLWPTIKSYFESMDRPSEEMPQFGETSESSEGGIMSMVPDGDPGESSDSDLNKEQKEMLENLMDAMKANGDHNSEERDASDGSDEVNTFDELEGEITKDDDSEIIDEDILSKDMDKLVTEINDEIAKEEAEENRTDKLNRDLKEDEKKFGNHKNIPITIKRMSKVDQSLINLYNTYTPPLIRISQQLQDKIADELEDRRKVVIQKNLYFGNRIEISAIAHDSDKIFSRRKNPDDFPSICVALVVDESGSMSCGGRIEAARKTAIILYDFCIGLEIPVIVYGHTADEDGNRGGVTLRSYAEFDTIDNNDKYRIMNLSARANNRDGAALEYMYNKLAERDEDIKLLFIISDGQPLASGYKGSSAIRDMKNIVEKYTNEEIITVAAAIGSDKKEIHRIYGDGFLDITDLNQMPKLLTDIIIDALQL